MSVDSTRRDLLPPAAAHRRARVAALLETFERWGYRQVVTPTLESYDSLVAGLSETDRGSVVRFVSAPRADVVALRSDVTPQIARMVAQHRGATWSASAVLRLSYTAEVVRHCPDARGQAQHHQVGVELVGDASPAADAELIALAHAALQAVGLKGFRFDLSHARIARGSVASLNLDTRSRAAVEALLARKDRGGLEALLRRLGAPSAEVACIAQLCTAYGPAERLESLQRVLRAPAARVGLENLQAIVAHMRAVYPEAASRVDVDLGEVRGFDYYTGVRLRAWCPNVARPVLRGGRYDDLIGRYGDPAAATGVALDLDALELGLGQAGEYPMVGRGTLIALDRGCPDGVRTHAAKLAVARRRDGEPAWVQSNLTLEQAKDLARRGHAIALAFLVLQQDAVHERTFRLDASGRWVES